jgi:hypothetical protein
MPGTDLAQKRSHSRLCRTHHTRSDQRKRWSACYLGRFGGLYRMDTSPIGPDPVATHFRYRVVIHRHGPDAGRFDRYDPAYTIAGASGRISSSWVQR